MAAAESETNDVPSNASTGIKLSPEVEQKIVRQIEYYFGNKNFPRDKFLRQKAEEDDGWVTLECLTTFNRLKALSTDTEAIAKVLRAHADAGLIEVSEDNKKVRRIPSAALPVESEEYRLEAKQRTVYCRGFPADLKLDALLEFFGAYGKVTHIFMRRRDDKAFKGSVFVEFEKVEDKTALLAMENVKYKDDELTVMSKADYFKKKREEQNEKKDKGEGKKTTGEEQKSEKGQQGLTIVKGGVLHLDGTSEQTSREDLKEIFGGHELISWVDYSKGSSEGYIRFANEGGAQRALDAVKQANDGKIMIREVEPTFRILEGEEEEKYWEKANEDRLKALQKKHEKAKRGRGRGGFGGRGFGGRGFGGRGKWNKKGQRDRTEESSGESPAKKPKMEASEDTKSHTRFEDAAE